MGIKLNYFLLFILMLTGSIFAQVDPGTANLTHSWTFNDGTANDYVGNANGVLMGGAGIEDGSLFMYTTGQWMEMPADVIALNTYDEVTIEVWFASFEGANTGYHMLAYFGDTSPSGQGINGYFITSARGDDKSRAAISCGVETNPWTGESGADGPEYDDGLLHHMASTLNATDITLYIDGELMASTPLAANNSIAAISPTFAYLAKGGYTADSTWQGEILEFNIYNRALTADEILFLSLKDPYAAVDQHNLAILPQEYGLLQNYPNPFNPATTIFFNLPQKSKVNMTVYDLSGREVVTILDEVKTPGQYSVQFDGTNMSSGVYICRMNIDNEIFTKKMTLLK